MIYGYVLGGYVIHPHRFDKRLSHYLCEVTKHSDDLTRRMCTCLSGIGHSFKMVDPALISVCKLLYQEALPILYSSNTFCFLWATSLSLFTTTLRKASSQARAPVLSFVRNVHIHTEIDFIVDWSRHFKSLKLHCPHIQRVTVSLEATPFANRLRTSAVDFTDLKRSFQFWESQVLVLATLTNIKKFKIGIKNSRASFSSRRQSWKAKVQRKFWKAHQEAKEVETGRKRGGKNGKAKKKLHASK